MCISRERNRSLREKGRALKVSDEYIGTMKMGSWRFSVFSLFLFFNFLRFFSILWNNLIWKFMELCPSENAQTKFIKKKIGQNLVMENMVFLYSDEMARVACPPFAVQSFNSFFFSHHKIIPLIVTWLKRWRCLIWTHIKVGPMQY